MDKRKRDQKAILQTIEVRGRVLIGNLNERGGTSKTRAICKQKAYKVLERKKNFF